MWYLDNQQLLQHIEGCEKKEPQTDDGYVCKRADCLVSVFIPGEQKVTEEEEMETGEGEDRDAPMVKKPKCD